MITTYFKNLIMGNTFATKTTPTLPTQYYLALSSTEPKSDGTGVTEPSTTGTAYARVLLDCLSEPNDGVIINENTVSFPESTAAWGTQNYYAVYDAADPGTGNLLYGDLLSPVRNVEINSVVAFKPESIKITLKDANPVAS